MNDQIRETIKGIILESINKAFMIYGYRNDPFPTSDLLELEELTNSTALQSALKIEEILDEEIQKKTSYNSNKFSTR